MSIFYAGSTSQSIDVFIPDSSSTTGGGKTGLAYNTASLTAYYRKGATGSATAITLATLANAQASWSSGGFVEIDSTNMPGLYRLDIPNAAIDTAGLVHIMLKGAANMAPTTLRIDCRPVKIDLTTAVPTSNTAETVGDCLNAARAQGFGKWVRSGTTLTLYANDGTTAVKTFTLDSGTAPTQRS